MRENKSQFISTKAHIHCSLRLVHKQEDSGPMAQKERKREKERGRGRERERESEREREREREREKQTRLLLPAAHSLILTPLCGHPSLCKLAVVWEGWLSKNKAMRTGRSSKQQLYWFESTKSRWTTSHCDLRRVGWQTGVWCEDR